MARPLVAVRLDVLSSPSSSPSSAARLRSGLDAAAHGGADGVEINARTDLRPEDLSDTGVRQIRKILDDRCLRIAAVRFPTRRGYQVDADLDRRIDATKSAMRMAVSLGCNVVVNAIGDPADGDDDGAARLRDSLNDLGRFGTHVGCFLAAEAGGQSGSQVADRLKTVDDGGIAAAVDPGLLTINRHDVAESMAALGSRVRVVYATDGVLDLAAGRGMAVPLGDGAVDYDHLLATLSVDHFAGPLIVTANPAASIEFLRGKLGTLKSMQD